MNQVFSFLTVLFLLVPAVAEAEPLRVFILAGPLQTGLRKDVGSMANVSGGTLLVASNKHRGF